MTHAARDCTRAVALLSVLLGFGACAGSATSDAPAAPQSDVIVLELPPAPPSPSANTSSATLRASASAPLPEAPPLEELVSLRAPTGSAGSLSVGGGAGIGGAGSGAGLAGRVPPRKPMAMAEVTLTRTTGGQIDNAGAVVAGMRAGFRRCHNRGLQTEPRSAGRVEIVARIGPNGEVLSANPKSTGTLASGVAACLAARVSSAQFNPPTKVPTTLTIVATLAPP